MNGGDLDLERVQPIDHNKESLKEGSSATPLSSLIWAIAGGNSATVESLIADDIEWGLMPYNKMLKGKDEAMAWFRAAMADRKQPIVMTNAMSKDWGVFEYWNIGTVSEDVIKLGNERNWPWPSKPESYLGRKYRVAQCFVYHVNSQGKIDLMRQYLDTGSIWAQIAQGEDDHAAG